MLLLLNDKELYRVVNPAAQRCCKLCFNATVILFQTML